MPINKIRTQAEEEVNMYNFMVVNVDEKKLHKDFLTYCRCDSEDELYSVSISDPALLEYLEEFMERRKN
jgi:hypothetical protein